MILGAGGSAKSIINSLVKEDIGSINILTRTPDKAIQLIDKYKKSSDIRMYKDDSKYDIIVNTTPVSLPVLC